MCNGELIPHSRPIATLIELAHRVSSGIALILIVGLIVWAFRAFPAGHAARKAAAWSVFFTFTEALIGAGLVLFEKVAKDQSFSRVVSLSVHLINTFLLVGAIALTAWFASGKPAISLRRTAWRTAALIGLAATLVLGVSGAITALGDTLYPSASLAEGFRSDFAATAHFLVRFRKYHPLVAVLTGAYLVVFAWLARRRTQTPLTTALIALVVTQLGLGALDVLLLAPVWLQLIHLLLADLVWICAVLLSASVTRKFEY
jgi:heme A synthase